MLILNLQLLSTLPSITQFHQKPAVFAVAGPIQGDKIPLTNGNWIIEPQKIISRFGLKTVIMLNDFEAQALALPF